MGAVIWQFSLLLSMTIVGLGLLLAKPMITRAQEPDPVKLHCIANWQPKFTPVAGIMPPSGLQAIVDVSESSLRLSWKDNATDETCYGFIAERQGDMVEVIGPVLATPVGHTEAILPLVVSGITGLRPALAPGIWCFRAFAANAGGLSAYSNEVCVQITADMIRIALPPTGTAGLRTSEDDRLGWQTMSIIAGGSLALIVAVGVQRRLAAPARHSRG